MVDDAGVIHKFDTLNEGSCFCVYQAFKRDTPMLFDFRVSSSTAVIFAVPLDRLEELAKKDLELADGIKKTKVEIIAGQKSEFDYFRFLAPLPEDSENDLEL